MADILGAAAGCCMMVMVLMLVGTFLARIGVLTSEKVRLAGRVFGRCGLFSIGIYGLSFVLEWFLYGTDQLLMMEGMLRHGLFFHLYVYTAPAHAWMQLQYMLMAFSGMMVYAAMHMEHGRKTAEKSLVFFYMLPGMAVCFLPSAVGFVPLLLAFAVLIFRKYIHPEKMLNHEGWMYGVYALFSLIQGICVYRMVSGV